MNFEAKTNNRNVVLISPNFFNLSTLIRCEIERQGYNCKWFDDRPSQHFLKKAILRIKPKLLKRETKRYFHEITKYCLSALPKKIIVIIGQSFSGEQFHQLKEALPKTEFVYYSWDSAMSLSFISDKFSVFDRSYSFDFEDCKKYGIKFLPLFYSFEPSNKPGETHYDYSFVGTIKKGKYQPLKEIFSSLDEKMVGYKFLYLQSPLVYWYYKINLNEFKQAKKKDFSFKKLTNEETQRTYQDSTYIIDVPMKNQTGLTIRTFDALHLNKKLITTNSSIKQYDFYTPTNILIWKKGMKPDWSSPFFTTPFDKAFSLKEKYSLHWFTKTLLGD